MKAKKCFGQNFLVDNTVLDAISNAVFASSNDLIIEIGPGTGALTNKLLTKNSEVIAYEVDNDLKPYLNKLESDRFKVIYKDFLKSNIKEDISHIKYNKLYIVGNLPYYITTPIIDHIIKSGVKFESLTIMVQKEVADRFLAEPRTSEYGYFTLYLKHYFEGELIVDVNKEAFNPMPKVKSAVVRFRPIKKVVINEDDFFAFLKECFFAKRKTLKNNLKNYDFNIILKVLNKYGFDEGARAEELEYNIFLEIFNNLYK